MIKTKGYAKINLFLEIVNKRKDGYHNIDSIFQTISIADQLKLERRKDKNIVIKMENFKIPLKKNIVYKVLEFFKEYFDISDGFNVFIKKNIPIGSGLGGSSADAAAILKALKKLYSVEFDYKFFNKISFLGADIMFQYYQGLAKVGGIGNRIKLIPHKLKGYLLIGYPGLIIESNWAYKNINLVLTENRFHSNILVRYLKQEDFEGVFQSLYNRFEDIVFDAYPRVEKLKNDFLKEGALTALMSGSGSSVFAIFEDYDDVKRAMRNLQKQWDWLKIAEFVY